MPGWIQHSKFGGKSAGRPANIICQNRVAGWWPALWLAALGAGQPQPTLDHPTLDHAGQIHQARGARLFEIGASQPLSWLAGPTQPTLEQAGIRLDCRGRHQPHQLTNHNKLAGRQRANWMPSVLQWMGGSLATCEWLASYWSAQLNHTKVFYKKLAGGSRPCFICALPPGPARARGLAG